MTSPTSKRRTFFGAFKFFLVLSALAALLPESGVAQETQQELRGIEKKDIRRDLRVIVAYTADSDAAAARALAQELEPIVGSIASGAKFTEADAVRTDQIQPIQLLGRTRGKLTKADAARTDQSSGSWLHIHQTAPHRFQNWLETMLSRKPEKFESQADRIQTFTAHSGGPSAGGACSSSCGMLGEWCICPLDHVPVRSTFTDVVPIIIVVNSRTIEPAQVEQLTAELKITLPSGTPIVREIKKRS